MLADVVFDKLENLPSLREGWVRLIHRCVADERVDNIKENGLKIDKEDLKVAKARIKQHLRQNKKDEPKKSAEAEKIATNLSLLKSAENQKAFEI